MSESGFWTREYMKRINEIPLLPKPSLDQREVKMQVKQLPKSEIEALYEQVMEQHKGESKLFAEIQAKDEEIKRLRIENVGLRAVLNSGK